MKTILLALTLIVSTSSYAFPLKKGMRFPILLTPVPVGAQDYDFEGAVGFSDCSGSLIRLETSTDADKAWVLTNGHCMDGFFMVAPGKARKNETANKSLRIYNSDLSDSVVMTAKKLLYGTMTGTDMAIYQLNESYADIIKREAIEAYTLSSTEPTVGTDIEVVSGHWKRGYSCKVDGIVHTLKEDRYTMRDSVRYSKPGCEIIGGTSGSPVIKAGTREVVAINNTSNEDGKACTMNNPCEIDAAGKKTYTKGTGYAQQTAQIYNCINSKREIDLMLSTCTMQK